MSNTLNSWMTNEVIQAKTLSQIVFPGTHDSGTYGLTNSLSTIKYSNIAFLWQLNEGAAPQNGQWPWKNKDQNGDAVYYVGQQMYNYIFSIIQQQSQSQDSTDTILNQLNNGIRFFDLRVYFDTTTTPNDYFIQHGLRGPSLENILADVNTFITNGKSSSSKELIFLQISHTNFDSSNITGVVNILQEILGDAIYCMPANTDLATFFTNTILSDIVDSGSRVIILNGDAPKFIYSNPIIYDGTFNATNSPSGVDNVSDLEGRELAALQNNPTGPWSISWALTPQLPDVVNYVLQTLMLGIGGTNGVEAPLEQLAQQANVALSDFINNEVVGKYSFNLITCDWYQQCGVNGIGPVVEIAMALSSTC